MMRGYINKVAKGFILLSTITITLLGGCVINVCADETLPSMYGNTLKTVNDQGDTGTCWAFAGTSLFEYAVDHRENITNTSFSVEHMIEKLSIYGDCGYGLDSKIAGGNREMCANYFVSGYGPVNSEDYPWIDSVNLVENYNFGKAEYRATDIMYMNPLGWKINTTNSLSDEDIAWIKDLVYRYGAVQASMYTPSTEEMYNTYIGSDGKSYLAYDKINHPTNHSVLIVGWDDNWSKDEFNTKPTSNGAWLVRNSWGTDRGDNGYLWVSYEDPTIRGVMTICDYEEMGEEDKVYNLDESGATNNYTESVTEGGFINVFEIEYLEKIKAVTFFANSKTETCQSYYVPINDNGTPNVSQKVELSDEVRVEYEGYHTIQIEENIQFESGTKCGIMVYLRDSSSISIGVESTTEDVHDNNITIATLNQGESFYWDNDGNITDMYNTSATGNFSIKLVTEDLTTSISECTISDVAATTYIGRAITPEVTITNNGRTLIKGEDYKLYYYNNVNAGTAKIVIEGIGLYRGNVEKTFIINRAHLSLCVISGIETQCYTGETVLPDFTISYNMIDLELNKDYVSPYGNAINVGTGMIVIVGIGNYQGSITINFTITNDLAYGVIDYLEIYEYTGQIISPDITVTMGDRTLVRNVDYVVTTFPREQINEGTYTSIIIGIGEYTGSQTITYSIVDTGN